jgi:hypothetical protein
MAQGDSVNGNVSVAYTAFMTIQPGSSIEWIIHNIHAPNTSDVELYVTDGSNDILIDGQIGSWLGFNFHLTNSNYIKVKNTSGGTIRMGYDGIVSK